MGEYWVRAVLVALCESGNVAGRHAIMCDITDVVHVPLLKLATTERRTLSDE